MDPSQPENTRDSKNRNNLFAELRKKMGLSLDEDDDVSCRANVKEQKRITRSTKLTGNRNASRSSRYILLGWIHHGKTVRLKTGGGTRRIMVAKDATKEDIICEGKKIFSEGLMKRGGIHEFEFDVLDYAECKMPEDVTVGDIYIERKVSGYFRFYMATKTIIQPSSDVSSLDIEESHSSRQNEKITNTHNPSCFEETLPMSRDVSLDIEEGHSTIQFGKITNTHNPSCFEETLPVACSTLPMACSTPVGNILPIFSPEDISPDTPMTVSIVTGSCRPAWPCFDNVERSDEIPFQGDEIELPIIARRNSRVASLPLPSDHEIIDQLLVAEVGADGNERRENSHGEASQACQETLPAEMQLLSWVYENVEPGDENELIIHRRKIIDSTIRGTTREEFSYLKPVNVKFPGEMGQDCGGPRREYFRLLMNATKGYVLEGEPLRLTFQHSLALLEKMAYKRAGMWVAWSVLHGGPSLPVMNENVVKLILGDTDMELTIADIHDEGTRQNILKIQEASTWADISELEGWMLDQGLPAMGHFNDETKQKLVLMAIKSNVYYRIHAEISQFQIGLNSVGGLLDRMKGYPQVIRGLLVHTDQVLTSQKIKDCMKINWSQDGSNDKAEEEDTLYAFEVFLQHCSSESASVKLGDFLSFWTGADDIPPLGFHKMLEVNFVKMDKQRLPVAHTCEMSLELPRGEDPDSFKQKMTTAVQWGGEFHLA